MTIIADSWTRSAIEFDVVNIVHNKELAQMGQDLWSA